MKKRLLCALVIALVMSVCAYSAVKFSVRIGYLIRLNTTEDEFRHIIESANKTNSWSVFSGNHELFGVKFYNSLPIMLLALNANEIDEMALPEMTASYLVYSNPDLEVCCAARSRSPMNLAFGLRGDLKGLAAKINKVLKDMEEDMTLADLQGRYLYNYDNFEPVKIEKFPGAETIRVAVTGDLPPIDFVAADGKPAGFNTAILAEIGRRLKLNIEIFQIEAGTRTAALMSQRADIVFWYETSKDPNYTADVSEGIIVSEPYYSWNTFLHVRKKQSRL